jgi:hypothetical protein
MPKDRMFILVMAAVLGGLAYWLSRIIGLLFDPSWDNIDEAHLWSMLVIDIVAIIGTLWLMRSYVKSRRNSRKRGNKRG